MPTMKNANRLRIRLTHLVCNRKAVVMKIAPLRRAARRAGSSSSGFTLMEIMIVVLIIGVLLNIAMPAFIHTRDEGQARACSSNLKRISSAKEQYALANNLAGDSPHAFTWTELNTYIRGNRPACPAGVSGQTTYAFNTVGTPPTCPYGGPAGEPHATAQ